jgi:hypothetical protein
MLDTKRSSLTMCVISLPFHSFLDVQTPEVEPEGAAAPAGAAEETAQEGALKAMWAPFNGYLNLTDLKQRWTERQARRAAAKEAKKKEKKARRAQKAAAAAQTESVNEATADLANTDASETQVGDAPSPIPRMLLQVHSRSVPCHAMPCCLSQQHYCTAHQMLGACHMYACCCYHSWLAFCRHMPHLLPLHMSGQHMAVHIVLPDEPC